MMEEATGSPSMLGILQKPKKKKPEPPGLLQSQIQKQPGALATMAQNAAMQTMNQGAMTETEPLQRKKKKLTGVSPYVTT